MGVHSFSLSHHRHPHTVIQARLIVQPRPGANQPARLCGFSSPSQEPPVESARLHNRLAISMSHRRDGGLIHPSSTGCTWRWRDSFGSSTAFPRVSNLGHRVSPGQCMYRDSTRAGETPKQLAIRHFWQHEPPQLKIPMGSPYTTTHVRTLLPARPRVTTRGLL